MFLEFLLQEEFLLGTSGCSLLETLSVLLNLLICFFFTNGLMLEMFLQTGLQDGLFCKKRHERILQMCIQQRLLGPAGSGILNPAGELDSTHMSTGRPGSDGCQMRKE